MPLKSKAQVRKYAELKIQGKITDSQFKEAIKATNFKNLPERVKPNKEHKKITNVKNVKVIK